MKLLEAPSAPRLLHSRRWSPLVFLALLAAALLSLLSLHSSSQFSTSHASPKSQQAYRLQADSGSCGNDSSSQTVKHAYADWPDTQRPLSLDATLEERLEAWSSVPVATAAEWHDFNLMTCPPHQNHNILLNGYVDNMVKNGAWRKYWLDPQKITQLREDLFDVLRYADRTGLLDPKIAGEGRGIVFAAGNSDTLERVLVSMRLLRWHFNSTLPAEVFSFPNEEPAEDVAADLQELGVRLRKVDFAKDQGKLKSYHLKAAAVLETNFQEVLFLDSDNYPAADVGLLFDSKAYQRLGAFFWPDYWKETPINPVWQLIGVQCRDEWTQEAGVFLIDKARHLDALTMVDYMLKKHETYYEFSDGDKDLFRFAMLALRKRWAVPGRILAAASWDEDVRKREFCSHTMLQHDQDGEPITVHGNMLKKLPRYIRFEDSARRPQPIWGKSKTINRVTLDEDDVDCDHIANVNLNTGHGLKRHSSERVALRNYADAGSRTHWVSNRVYSACLDRRWDVPGNDDDRIVLEQQARLADKPVEEVVTQLGGQKALVHALWKDDARLADFEKMFKDVGGVPQGKGF